MGSLGVIGRAASAVVVLTCLGASLGGCGTERLASGAPGGGATATATVTARVVMGASGLGGSSGAATGTTLTGVGTAEPVTTVVPTWEPPASDTPWTPTPRPTWSSPSTPRVVGHSTGGTAVVWADYHQVLLVPPDGPWGTFKHDGGSLISANEPDEVGGPAGVTLFTGCAMGPVGVTVQVLAAAPTQLSPTAPVPGYERTEEVSLQVRSALSLQTLTGGPLSGDSDAFDGPDGIYRFRVSATGRNTSYDAAVDRVEEHYLVQIWPETALRPRVARGHDL